MDSIQLFKQAAKEMQNDERYVQLAKARKANDEDTALQNKINEFNLVRTELTMEMQNDPRNDEKVAELNTRINSLYSEVMTNPSMLAYNDAKDNIKGLISHINAIIAAAVDGDDPMLVEEPNSGCGDGGCSSCSGCG